MRGRAARVLVACCVLGCLFGDVDSASVCTANAMNNNPPAFISTVHLNSVPGKSYIQILVAYNASCTNCPCLIDTNSGKDIGSTGGCVVPINDIWIEAYNGFANGKEKGEFNANLFGSLMDCKGRVDLPNGGNAVLFVTTGSTGGGEPRVPTSAHVPSPRICWHAQCSKSLSLSAVRVVAMTRR